MLSLVGAKHIAVLYFSSHLGIDIEIIVGDFSGWGPPSSYSHGQGGAPTGLA